MDSFEIRSKVDSIKAKLRHNAATFVFDDSAELIREWMDLQRACNHANEAGVSYFELEERIHCPICELPAKKEVV